MKLTSYLTVLTLVGSTMFVDAKTKAKATPEMSPAATATATPAMAETKMKKTPFRGMILAVDAAKGTFTTENKEKTITKTYTVTKSSKVTKMDKDATLADAKAGDYVRGSAIKTGPMAYEIFSVKIGPKTAEELAADAAAKEKRAAKAAAKASPMASPMASPAK